MDFILRILTAIASPITGLFAAHGTLNFDIVQTMVVLLLIVACLIVVALWPRHRKGT